MKKSALGVDDRLDALGDVLGTPSHRLPPARQGEDRPPLPLGAASHVELVPAEQPAGVEHLVREQAPAIGRDCDPITAPRPGPHPVAHQQVGRRRRSTSSAGIVGDEFPAVAGAVLDHPPTDLTVAVVLVGMPMPHAQLTTQGSDPSAGSVEQGHRFIERGHASHAIPAASGQAGHPLTSRSR